MSEPKIETEKARRAARHPQRPGESCRAAPGTFHPVVDHARCEGKRDCVEVCPYGVFEVRRIEDAARADDRSRDAYVRRVLELATK